MNEISIWIHLWGLEGPEMEQTDLKQLWKKYRGGRPLVENFQFIAGPALGRAQGRFCDMFILTSGAKGPPTYL